VQGAGIAICIVTGTDQLAWYLLAWAVSVWVAGMLGVRQFSRPSGLPRSISWIREHLGLSLRLGADYLLNMGTVALTTSVLVSLLGFAATGGLRFAQTLLGPIQVLLAALGSFMVPLLARRLAVRGAPSIRRPASLMALGSCGVAAVVLLVLLVLPATVGEELLGESWDEARLVMPAVGLSACLVALAMGGSLSLKVLGRADLLFRVTMLQAPLIFLLGVGGGLWLGIQGAAWGLATAQGVGCAVIVVVAWRATAAAPRHALVTQSD